MSKERARRREARERQAAEHAEAQASAAVKAARQRRRRAFWERRMAVLSSGSGQPTGILARRRRTRLNLIVIALFLTQVVVWIARPDWAARLAALVITLLAFPVIAAFAL